MHQASAHWSFGLETTGWRRKHRGCTVKERNLGRGPPVTRRAILTALAAILLSSAGCSIPNFEGPQIQEPPRGFFLQPETVQQRRMFPEHEPTFHTTWVHTDVSGVSVIFVEGHAGVLDVNDVTVALEGAMAATTDADRSFSNIELLTIDGRRGWGWSERVESDRRGLEDVAYKAVIPYDTITYAIEFISGEPAWKMSAPDTLRAVISTFAVGRTTWNVPLLAIIFGGGLLGFGTLRSRSQKRTQQLRSINLVTIEKDEEKKEADGSSGPEAAPPAPAPTATAPAPTPPPRVAPPPPVSPTEMSSPPRPPKGGDDSA